MSGLVAGEMRVKEESGFWVLSKRVPSCTSTGLVCASVGLVCSSTGLVSVLVWVVSVLVWAVSAFDWVKGGVLYPSAWKPEARSPVLVIVGRRVRLSPKSLETA